MNPNFQLKQKIAKLDHEITHNFETAYQKYWQELQNKTLDFLAQQQVNDRTTPRHLCYAGFAPAGKDLCFAGFAPAGKDLCFAGFAPAGKEQSCCLCFAGMTSHAPAPSWGWGKDIINKNGSTNKNALTSVPTSALTSVPTGVFASVPKNSTGALEINSKDPEILFWQIRWKLENDLKTP